MKKKGARSISKKLPMMYSSERASKGCVRGTHGSDASYLPRCPIPVERKNKLVVERLETERKRGKEYNGSHLRAGGGAEGRNARRTKQSLGDFAKSTFCETK
eukprot:scaffold117777_cov63-Phaeocystis_antarctica.AAC.4